MEAIVLIIISNVLGQNRGAKVLLQSDPTTSTMVANHNNKRPFSWCCWTWKMVPNSAIRVIEAMMAACESIQAIFCWFTPRLVVVGVMKKRKKAKPTPKAALMAALIISSRFTIESPRSCYISSFTSLSVIRLALLFRFWQKKSSLFRKDLHRLYNIKLEITDKNPGGLVIYR